MLCHLVYATKGYFLNTHSVKQIHEINSVEIWKVTSCEFEISYCFTNLLHQFLAILTRNFQFSNFLQVNSQPMLDPKCLKKVPSKYSQTKLVVNVIVKIHPKKYFLFFFRKKIFSYILGWLLAHFLTSSPKSNRIIPFPQNISPHFQIMADQVAK